MMEKLNHETEIYDLKTSSLLCQSQVYLLLLIPFLFGFCVWIAPHLVSMPDLTQIPKIFVHHVIDGCAPDPVRHIRFLSAISLIPLGYFVLIKNSKQFQLLSLTIAQKPHPLKGFLTIAPQLILNVGLLAFIVYMWKFSGTII